MSAATFFRFSYCQPVTSLHYAYGITGELFEHVREHLFELLEFQIWKFIHYCQILSVFCLFLCIGPYTINSKFYPQLFIVLGRTTVVLTCYMVHFGPYKNFSENDERSWKLGSLLLILHFKTWQRCVGRSCVHLAVNLGRI